MSAGHYLCEGNSQLLSDTNAYCCFYKNPPLNHLLNHLKHIRYYSMFSGFEFAFNNIPRPRLSRVFSLHVMVFNKKLNAFLIRNTTAVKLEWFTQYVTCLVQFVWIHIVSTSLTLLGETAKMGAYCLYGAFQSYKLSLHSDLKLVFNTMHAAKKSSLF
jgi:hypothetical protein